MGIAALIAEAKQAYAVAGLDCGDALLPPAGDPAIDAIGEACGVPIPPELRDVYNVHGGQAYIGPGVTGLFGRHRLHTPAEVIECHRVYFENCQPPPVYEPNYWIPRLVPFASWDANTLCIDAESGEVWDFHPHAGLADHRASISAVLREVIGAVRSGLEPQLGVWDGS